MPLIVGLTGGIASGKTTVANLFQQHFSIEIIDADVIARDVVAKGSKGLDEIVNHCGEGILLEDGTLNRSALREKVFASPNEKKWLDSLLHPMIRQKMQQDISKITTPYALLVVPLLVENQLQSMTDRILVIDVSPEIQLKRTIARDNVSQTQANAILASQASREVRLQFADDIINNDNHELLPQVTQLHNQYMALAVNLDK